MGYIPGHGDAQQTVTSQLVMSRMAGARTGTKRPKKKPVARRVAAVRPARRAAPAARRAAPAKRASAARPARLVKGSMAAKRYMASIRKRRR